MPTRCPELIKLWAFWFAWLGLILLAGARFIFPDFFDRFFLEQKGFISELVIEDIQVVVLAITIVFFGLIIMRLASRGWRKYFVLIALLILFVVLEEISFGQHALGFESPQSVRDLNSQGELTLHNLAWFQDYLLFGDRFSFLRLIALFVPLILSCCWFVIGQVKGLSRFWPAVPGYYSLPLFLFALIVQIFNDVHRTRFAEYLAEFSGTSWAIRVIDMEVAETALYLGVLLWSVVVYAAVLSDARSPLEERQKGD